MKISKHCYMISGLSGPEHWVPIAGFVTGSKKTLIIDTGMTYMSGRTIHGYAKAAKPDNEIMVGITEPHFDHIGGSCFFAEKSIDIYAHKDVKRPEALIDVAKAELNGIIENKSRKAAREEDAFYLNTRIQNPNRIIAPGDVFDLGGVRIRVIDTPGHTPANLSYHVVEDHVLYCGDAVVTHYMPNLEAGRPEDWRIWLQTLGRIEKIDPGIIVPGHGDLITGKNIAVQLGRMKGFVEKAVATGIAPTIQVDAP